MVLRQKHLMILLLLPSLLMAAEKRTDEQPKEISGMSIMGNNETPKSLYIVPWKSSEIGSETNMTSDLLNEDMKPVDKTVFMRELDFYNLSVAK
jgi:hypothetical protein